MWSRSPSLVRPVCVVRTATSSSCRLRAVVKPATSGRGGILEDLGVYQALLDVFEFGEPRTEYGVIEHRFAQANRDLYVDLVGRYHHTAIACEDPARFTVSSLLAGALGRLHAEGAVRFSDGPGTGRWSYLNPVSYWALPPVPDRPPVTWTAWAQANGIDPDTWPATEGLRCRHTSG